MQTSIVNWGNSQGIRLPKLLLDSVNLSSNDAVEVRTVGEQIIITKAKTPDKQPRKSIQELFEGYDETFFQTEEAQWGKPQGEEVW